MDQEEIAQAFAAYDLVALTRARRERRARGQVTIDDIVDVINDEATEDMY